MLVAEMNRQNRHSEGSRKDSVSVLFLKLGPYQDHPLAFGLLVELKRSELIWNFFEYLRIGKIRIFWNYFGSVSARYWFSEIGN